MRELTPDLYFLFGEGMELTEEHVEEIFGTKDLHLEYPDLINKSLHTNPRFVPTAWLQYVLPKPIKYDIKRFVEKAPNIYHYSYKANVRPHPGLLEVLDPVDGKSQIYHGFISGFLRYNRARSFYFDEKGATILDQYIEGGH